MVSCETSMMNPMRLLLICTLSNTVISTAYQNIPVGAVFNIGSTGLLDAFQYAVLVHNFNNTYPNWKILYAPVTVANISDEFKLKEAICKEMKKKRVFAMFGDSRPHTYNIVQRVGKATNVPYLLSNAYRFHNESPYDISMTPSYIAAVWDIIKHHNWKRIFYVYDQNDGLRRLETLYHSFTRKNKPTIYARPIFSLKTIHEELRKIDRYNAYRKIIIVDLENTEAYQTFLTSVMDVGMNKDGYHYVLCGYHLEALKLTRFLHGGVNITGFRLIDPKKKFHRQFYRQWMQSRKQDHFPNLFDSKTKRLSLESALVIDSVRLFAAALDILHKKYHIVFNHTTSTTNSQPEDGEMNCWMKPDSKWQHGPTVLSALKQVKIKGLSGHLELGNDGLRTNFRLDIMELKYKAPIRMIARWSERTGYLEFKQPPRPTVNLNASTCTFENRGTSRCPFRITTIKVQPFVFENLNKNGQPYLEGYCIDFIDLLAKKLNFEYVIQLVKDGQYGMKEANEEWTGMIGEVLRQEADMAVAPLSITEKRQQDVDFSTPFMRTGISIMIKRPEIQKPGLFSFMDPLSNRVWLCVALAFVSVSIIMFFVGRIDPYEHKYDSNTKAAEFENQYTIANTTWSALGALMQQGSEIYPVSMSGRVLSCVWWFFTLILVSSYTANLAAFLTVENLVVPINSADDLIKQTEIEYGIQENGSTMEFFKKTGVYVYQRMWDYMRLNPDVFRNSTRDGIEAVRKRKGKYAFLLESTINEYNNQRKPCNTIRVGANLDTKGYGIAIQPKSLLREQLSVAILNLTESGELHKLYQKWWYSKGECKVPTTQGKAKSSMTLSNVRGMFYILIGGLTFAVLSSAFTYLFAAKRQEMKQKRDKEEMKSKAECYENEDSSVS